ncbi:MAG: DsbA family protein [Burkholderiales bacterium]
MKLFKVLLLSCLLAFASGACAEAKLDKDYRFIPQPQSVETGNKIEVVEFFYYGCSHCFDAEPYLKKWKSSMAQDVAFRRIPAVFRESWLPLTKTFCTLEALGELERLHGDVFDAIHLKGINMNDQNVMFDWVEKHGVDRKKFADTYESFAIRNRVENARRLTQAYSVEGTPSYIVDGKYITGPGFAGSHENSIKVLDELINKARQERTKR